MLVNGTTAGFSFFLPLITRIESNCSVHWIQLYIIHTCNAWKLNSTEYNWLVCKIQLTYYLSLNLKLNYKLNAMGFNTTYERLEKTEPTCNSIDQHLEVHWNSGSQLDSTLHHAHIWCLIVECHGIQLASL